MITRLLTLIIVIYIAYVVTVTEGKHAYNNTSSTVTNIFAKNTAVEYNPWSNFN